MRDDWDRLPGEPDEYWQCVECELLLLPDAPGAGDTCPECGNTMVYVSDDVPEEWDVFEATVAAVRRQIDSRQN